MTGLGESAGWFVVGFDDCLLWVIGGSDCAFRLWLRCSSLCGFDLLVVWVLVNSVVIGVCLYGFRCFICCNVWHCCRFKVLLLLFVGLVY